MADQSRNSWIKQDNPKLISAKHKDIFEDILEERRHTSDIRWVTRSREIPTYKYNKPRTSLEIKQNVRASDRVKYAVEEVCKETGMTKDEAYKQVDEILDEMAHTKRMGAIRSFALLLCKVMKELLHRIYVNEEGIQKVREMIHEYPVLLMPSHRSYMDFLLMSYIFYHYDLPLPVIAAAMDFKGMKFFGWLLRNSGAFYIRRSFGDDQLYWAVFTEYVQTQICNADHPVEFYVEGTRSRTAKSYTPKFGMLSASLEPYFKAHLPDVMVIPITISYERVLEEKLYAYELLGVPKPKESTSGLLKARSILAEDFGNVHVHFGDPVSIRNYSVSKLDRTVHNLAPRIPPSAGPAVIPMPTKTSDMPCYTEEQKMFSLFIISLPSLRSYHFCREIFQLLLTATGLFEGTSRISIDGNVTMKNGKQAIVSDDVKARFVDISPLKSSDSKYFRLGADFTKKVLAKTPSSNAGRYLLFVSTPSLGHPRYARR
ncbi:hypothetical protein ScPMuIL_013530 [Solemya velum]